MAFTLKRSESEILSTSTNMILRSRIRSDTSAKGETEYVLSTTHYFFVWPVESTIRVRADNHLLLKKKG